MQGTSLSELSERKILGGNQHALPVDIFPQDLSYVALGHLHRAQKVGREQVRYSGSPIPLSMTELDYVHQVVLVELEGEQPGKISPLPIPRAVEVSRLPAGGPRSLPEVIALLATLPARTALHEGARPMVEVCVALDQPQPHLKREIENALEGKEARLAKISVTWPTRVDSELLTPGAHLSDLIPEDVFRARYRREFQNEPPDPLVATFHELVEFVHGGTGK